MLLARDGRGNKLNGVVSFRNIPMKEGEVLSWEYEFQSGSKPTPLPVDFKVGIYRVGRAKVFVYYHNESWTNVRIESLDGQSLEDAIEWITAKLGWAIETIYPANPTQDSFVRGVANDIRTLIASIKTQLNKLRR